MKRSLAKKNRPTVKSLPVSTEKDWGDYKSDLDRMHTHSVFAGRTNPEMQPVFRRSPIERTDELRRMPEVPFRYYMLGFKDFIMAKEFDNLDAPDAASCFLTPTCRGCRARCPAAQLLHPALRFCLR